MFVGCQSIRPKHITPYPGNLTANCQLPTANFPLPAPFSSPEFKKALFKASLDIKEYHLTGLVFVKKIPDTLGNGPSYRVVFSNEFGMTYFDVETGNNLFKVLYCFEPLDKKMLWKILETDFRMLFSSECDSLNGKWFVQKKTNYHIFKHKQQNIRRWDVYSSSADSLLEIRGKTSIADKTLIGFSHYRAGFPSKISLVNPLINLKLSLSLISFN